VEREKGQTVIVAVQEDVGRRVIYRAAPDFEPQEGVITSVRDDCVFVRYGIGCTSARTEMKDLEWK
jgi:hypothetical protein